MKVGNCEVIDESTRRCAAFVERSHESSGDVGTPFAK
jgi:hypothetical protein